MIRKQKGSLGKTVLKRWSQIFGKITMLVYKVTLKKKCEKVKTHKTEKRTFFKSIFLRPFCHFSTNMRSHFQNSLNVNKHKTGIVGKKLFI